MAGPFPCSARPGPMIRARVRNSFTKTPPCELKSQDSISGDFHLDQVILEQPGGSWFWLICQDFSNTSPVSDDTGTISPRLSLLDLSAELSDNWRCVSPD
eukprot:scpid79056/ scgid25529/ 